MHALFRECVHLAFWWPCSWLIHDNLISGMHAHLHNDVMNPYVFVNVYFCLLVALLRNNNPTKNLYINRSFCSLINIKTFHLYSSESLPFWIHHQSYLFSLSQLMKVKIDVTDIPLWLCKKVLVQVYSWCVLLVWMWYVTGLSSNECALKCHSTSFCIVLLYAILLIVWSHIELGKKYIYIASNENKE